MAQPPGEPDVAALPPTLPPAVPQDPELRAVLLLTVTQGCHRVSVVGPFRGGDYGAAMGRKKLSTIGVTNLMRGML